MIPIRDHNPSRRVPYVTYALLAANILIFLSYGFEPNGRAAAMVFGSFGAIPIEIAQGFELHTLVTSMFLHGGWMHLAGNMLFLYIFGDNMEDQLGHLPFAGFYAIGGVLATLAHIAVDPFSRIPLVGASGAIAAVMGGYLLLFPKARIDIFVFFVIIIRIIPVPAWMVLAIWFGLQLFNGVSAGSASAVAYWAHAGGFIAGFVMTLPWWIARGGQRFWQQTQMHPPHPEAQYTRSHIPRTGRRNTGPWGPKR